MKRWLCIALVATSILGARASGFLADPTVAQRLRQLGDPDPRVRENAFHDLRRAGFGARNQVFEATFSDNPQIRAAAAEVLMLLPWIAANESSQLRQLLVDYGSKPTKARLDIGTVLAAERKPQSLRVALRIITEDQSPEVAWEVAEALDPRLIPQAGELIENLDLTFARAPILTVAAKYYLPRDRDKAIAMLRRAIEVDPPGQVFERDPLEWAFDRLVLDCVMRNQLDEAAALRRAQDDRTRFSGEANARAIFHLFALHARFGPLTGLENDLRDHSHRLADPAILYALSRVYDRCGMPLAARALANAATARPAHNLDERQQLARLLELYDWFDFVERELMLRRELQQAMGDNLQVVNSNLTLSAVLERAGNYTRAADTLDEAIRVLLEQGRTATRTNLIGETELLSADELKALSQFYRFKAASRANDADAQLRHAEAILKLDQVNDSIAVEIVPFLESLNRNEDADVLFRRTQAHLLKMLEKHPEHAGLKNELSWLLARTGRNVEEAYRLAKSAVDSEPDNPSFIDTLAEAAFRVGRVDDAISLSKRSIELRPNYAFFHQQLARFQQAAATRPSN